ncbi:MAG TPA: PDZ domain-containing protein [Pirellulales bacterium]|jgi:membrane-associated protease RseP (regulator of RpoE activity)|nr:PDZ domain-containing protein [Pirellulales bacterium]
MKRISLVLSVAAIMLAAVSIASAQTSPAQNTAAQNTAAQKSPATRQNNSGQQQASSQANEQNQQNDRAFLGVAYEPVPKAIASQLASGFPQLAHGSGVLITQVMHNSPAAKGGIKPYDLVTEVNNKPIKSADELMKMVSQEKPGEKLALQIVRASKAENLNVTLGERPIVRGQAPENSAENDQNENAEGNDQASQGNVAAELESFDALSLERTGKDQFKAEIKFRDKQGKIDTRTFQGNREEIRKDILSQNDLPKSERHQLLGSLRLPMELLPANSQQSGSQESGTQTKSGNSSQAKGTRENGNPSNSTH